MGLNNAGFCGSYGDKSKRRRRIRSLLGLEDFSKIKHYSYSEEKIRLEGREYSAIFPKEHSRIKGIAVHSFNANAWDAWANIPDYRTICYVLWQGQKDWKKEYEGKSDKFAINSRKLGAFEGLYTLLFDLESCEVRKDFLKKQEVRDLKKEIKEKSRRLEELTKAF